jgi:putative membrane protein
MRFEKIYKKQISTLMTNKKYLSILIIIFFIILIWSGINPKDYFTWFLEVIPGLLGFIILALTYKRFRFTNLLYTLMLIHCAVLFFGGKYTYAENPLFEYIKQIFDLQRNNYDKLGHFLQGFIPTMIAREILIRENIIANKKWIPFFLLCIAMFISSIYELIEWMVAVLKGESADAFLGTQGYIWDTQSDMLFAFIGSIFAIIFLSKKHNELISKICKDE